MLGIVCRKYSYFLSEDRFTCLVFIGRQNIMQPASAEHISPGGNLTYRALPLYSARLVLKCSLECAEHVTTCFQRIFWDALELQPLM